MLTRPELAHTSNSSSDSPNIQVIYTQNDTPRSIERSLLIWANECVISKHAYIYPAKLERDLKEKSVNGFLGRRSTRA